MVDTTKIVIMSTPTPTSSSSTTKTKVYTKQDDKLRNGPCSKIYQQLEQCAIRQGVNVNNHKLKLRACPSDTDRLIKCMNKHPVHFYSGN